MSNDEALTIGKLQGGVLGQLLEAIFKAPVGSPITPEMKQQAQQVQQQMR
ncbi:hypothetical protein [Streptomyces telluris]|uniref:Uncharacterized protein n=1 Tax=Streptomyces telluris TaxID=2720021 RepID=A0A9X2LPZ7_9ACTN|nr:hypothetical protein [Streptomyces telluris]MCQ8775029.1 hypothetical protein [Streptomyces telluris]